MPTPAPLDIEDAAQVRPYLRARGFFPGACAIHVEPLSGGVSCKVVRVRADGAGDGLVLKQALGRLRVAVEWFSPPERIHREALGLRWLQRLEPAGAVPRFLFEDFASHLLAMSAVPQPHRNLKGELMAGRVEPEIARQMGVLLAQLHNIKDGPGEDPAAVFADRSYFESLRLEPYYLFAAQATVEARDFLTALVAETRTHAEALVHGDFSPKNLLCHQGRLCLLDHEVIHWGDPAFDVGFALTHFLSKAHHFPLWRSRFADAARRFFSAYQGAAGWEPQRERRIVAHTLGCLLARVDGRSPLEYLSPREREGQRRAVLKLLSTPPRNVPECIDRFLDLIIYGND